MAPLTPLRLFKGDPLNELVETFAGYAELGAGAGAQATYSGGNVTIADGGGDTLPLGSLDSGVELLDRSAPANCTMLESGVYAVTANLVCSGMTAGGSWAAGISGGQGAGAATTFLFGGLGTSTLTYVSGYLAGDALVVVAINRDGAVARDFAVSSLTLVKLA